MLKGLREKLKWLDPFTYVDMYIMPHVNPSGNKIVGEVVYLFSAFIFAYILYNFVFALILGTSTPLVIVYSGSMEPVLFRGDVVVLTGAASVNAAQVVVDFPVGNKNIHEYATIGYKTTLQGLPRAAALNISGKEYLFDESGGIVVYFSDLKGQDIIHRSVLKLKAPDGEFLITLGDNNGRIDQDCWQIKCITSYPVPLKDIKGKYLFHIPLIGYVKLLLFDGLPKLLLR